MVRLAVTVTVFGLLTASCSWKSVKPSSVLVITVEGLGFKAFSCGEGVERERPLGFRAFCDEAVRFTHAYAPSLLSQASLASILTAKYPFEHGVRHNGAQTLSAKERTISEVAWRQGFRTSLFSGGAPILRRSGMSQGFEVFDDNISLTLKRIYRSAPEVVRLFLNWRESEASGARFLSFLFFNDLQMVDTPTANELGEVRESSYQSQVDTVDEALSLLVKEMKRSKIWDATDVILVGLQGTGLDRAGEIPMTDLFSEGTRTTLMIKPARKVRDGPFNWKVDTNVSLVDLGATLFDLVGAPRPPRERGLSHSLKSVLAGPEPDWSNERMIVSETAWPEWRYGQSIRAAARRGPYLYLFDESPRLFNTFTDNSEATPVPTRESGSAGIRVLFSEFLRSKGYQAWRPLNNLILERAQLARALWRNDNEAGGEAYRQLIEMAKRRKSDVILQGWRASWALRRSDWRELKNAAEAFSLGAMGLKQPLWSYVAARNLGEKPPIPDEPCLSFLRDAHALSKDCRLDGWADFLVWADENASEAMRTKAADAFFRVYLARSLATRIGEHNLLIGEAIDSSDRLDDPDLVELLLALPEWKKQRAVIHAKLGGEFGRAVKE